jgi:ABC-type siderophore export system fused ATPase/permease subunit
MDENTSLQLWSLVEDDQIPDFRRRFYRAQLSISNADFKPNKPVWR